MGLLSIPLFRLVGTVKSLKTFPVWFPTVGLSLMFQRSLPFCPRGESLRRDRALDSQYSVKMIDLVLNQLRKISLGFEGLFRAAIVQIINSNLAGPRNPNHQIGKTKTIVP